MYRAPTKKLAGKRRWKSRKRMAPVQPVGRGNSFDICGCGAYCQRTLVRAPGRKPIFAVHDREAVNGMHIREAVNS